MNFSPRLRLALVLTGFVLLYLSLGVLSYRQKSATWDEPQHVLRGWLGWRGDQRGDPEHPPLLRLWAALPVAFDKSLTLDTNVINQVAPADWVGSVQFQYAHHYLYKANDADRFLYRQRFMILLLGALLGLLLFAWTHEWLGFWPAVGGLALYCCEPNLFAHATLVTTDFGATCFMFGTLYFLWRSLHQTNAGAASVPRSSLLDPAAAILCFALAMTSKFTTLLLVPAILILLGVDAYRRRSLTRAAVIIAGMLLLTWLAMWAVYGCRYAPSANPDWLFRFQDGSPFGNQFPLFARLAGWADDHRLLPNACAQGFLLGQIKAQARGAYLLGEISSTGWWYYFPVAFFLKTPVTILLLLAGGLVVMLTRWRKLIGTPLFLLTPIVVILGVAMTQNLNIGLRHILPVYPLVLMICAVAIAWLLRRARWLAVVAVVGAALEFFSVYPSPLAFFNFAVGGPARGSEYLVDSNLDWGQDLKGLKQWQTAHADAPLNLCYFGTADPAYYGLNFTPLPGHGFMERGAPPRLPGYVAISATNLRGVYFAPPLRQFYAPLLSMKPVAVIGHSIFIYRVERPWWP